MGDGMRPITLAEVTIENRQPFGEHWIQVRGTVHGKLVSVDVPKQRLFGLSDAQAEDQMKRALRAGFPYARE